MNDLKISSKYPTLIFDFLSHLVKEANVLDLNNVKLMVYLQYILTETAALE